MMQAENDVISNDFTSWICLDIPTYWTLAIVRSSNEVILLSTEGNREFRFLLAEGYALQHFFGEMTSLQIQNQCEQQFKDAIPADLVVELLQKLIALGILRLPTDELEIPPAVKNNSLLLNLVGNGFSTQPAEY